MGFSRVILDKRQAFLDGKFIALIKVYEVEKSDKYPLGIKSKFILIDSAENYPVLLIDNHEPYGFHIHSALPENKNFRERLYIEYYEEALSIFENKVMEIIKYENSKNTY